MARTGRKSNPKAKRKQTTRAGRGVGEMNVFLLRRRLDAVGEVLATGTDDRAVVAAAKRAGVMTMSTEYPLDVLAARGLLERKGEATGTGRLRADAGALLAALYWRVYGRPAQAQDVGFTAPDLEVAAPAKATLMTAEERFERDAAWLNRMFWRLGGGHTAAVVIKTAVHCEMPRPAQLAPLRRGLQRLIEATS